MTNVVFKNVSYNAARSTSFTLDNQHPSAVHSCDCRVKTIRCEYSTDFVEYEIFFVVSCLLASRWHLAHVKGAVVVGTGRDNCTCRNNFSAFAQGQLKLAYKLKELYSEWSGGALLK